MFNRTVFVDQTPCLPVIEEKARPTAEQIEAARAADRIPLSALRPQFRCSQEQFNGIISTKSFPQSPGRITRTKELYWSRQAINAWLEQQHAFVAPMPKILK